MFKFPRTTKKVRQPDMTPLVDIIFQLLLFFMLTTSFTQLKAIDVYVNAPKTEEAPNLANMLVGTEIAVNLKPGEVLIDDVKFAPAAFAAAYKKEAALDKNRPTRIVTEKGVSIQRLVEAVDVVKANSTGNLTIDVAENNQIGVTAGQVPEPVPLPDLQSTKKASGSSNAGSFNFDNLEKNFAPDEQPQ